MRAMRLYRLSDIHAVPPESEPDTDMDGHRAEDQAPLWRHELAKPL
jgi:hypothetical protein